MLGKKIKTHRLLTCSLFFIPSKNLTNLFCLINLNRNYASNEQIKSETIKTLVVF